MYQYNGILLKQYCKNNGINYNTVWQRIKKHGWTIEEAVTGIRNQQNFSYPGEERREVKGYEGLYDVSNYGRIRSYRRVTNGVREVWHISRLLSPRRTPELKNRYTHTLRYCRKA